MAADIDHNSSSQVVRDQALAWFVRLQSGEASAAERESFETWRAADPMHGVEYDRVAAVWRDIDAIPDPRQSPRVEPASYQTPHLSRRGLLAGLGGAGLAVAAAGFVGGDLVSLLKGDLRTGTGERARMALPDGSFAELDAATTLSLDFTAERRYVRLHEGRALFTVAADPTRPFDVACDDGVVRALGTAFVVHRRAANVAVAVTESAVTVLLGAEQGGGVRVSAGEMIVYGEKGIGRPRSDSQLVETSWRDGQLVFREQRLSDVVADIGRYRSGRIVIWDDALTQLRVDGVFDMRNPDAALAAIVATLPVRMLQLSPYMTVLRQA
ncbi:MAG: hypothetical protein K0Q70_2642 [Rhodospirillales bacterium]|nr:hypothetical protein [Rhodospirillales bacterium]